MDKFQFIPKKYTARLARSERRVLPFSVFNCNHYNHCCCTISVVRVLDRVCVHKAVQMFLKLCCTALRFKTHSHSWDFSLSE